MLGFFFWVTSARSCSTTNEIRAKGEVARGAHSRRVLSRGCGVDAGAAVARANCVHKLVFGLRVGEVVGGQCIADRAHWRGTPSRRQVTIRK
jgi:hypothetical protein